jgi:hypothetical protein
MVLTGDDQNTGTIRRVLMVTFVSNLLYTNYNFHGTCKFKTIHKLRSDYEHKSLYYDGHVP